jgi:ABC-2 type transport system ATP-binding protein
LNALRKLAILVAILLASSLPRAESATTTTSGFVTSFDGTSIRYNLFQPSTASATAPAPIIFSGPGWSSAGATSLSGVLADLADAGYGVLTWDPRGFGASGGYANVDSQDFEVRDVQALIDMVAGLDWVAKEGADDPVMGMIGVSYGGGIQLQVASADDRVDAIVPQIAWNDLPQSLQPNGVLKLHWDLPLYAVGVNGSTGFSSPDGPKVANLAPEIHQSLAEGVALNDWSQPIKDWYADKSPGRYINGGTSMGGRTVTGITAPALVMQGANDTLFPINQGVANWRQIRANGVDSRIVFFCGTLLASGDAATTHTIDLQSPCTATGATHMNDRALAWFDHHLRGADVDLGPVVEYQTQDGAFHALSDLPSTTVAASGEGVVANAVAPTNGVGTAPRPAADGFEVPIADGPVTAVGVPHATVQVTGAGPEAFLFFKLLDVSADGSAVVIDDQTMPLKVTNLDLQVPQTFSIDLAGVSWAVPDGHSLVLEVTSTSNEYASSRTPAVAQVDVAVSVPVA